MNTDDPDRRGRVAFERYHVALPSTRIDWVRLGAAEQAAWCHAAEAAFEEGRAFEREQYAAQDGHDGVVLQPGERMISYIYETKRGSRVAVEVTE